MENLKQESKIEIKDESKIEPERNIEQRLADIKSILESEPGLSKTEEQPEQPEQLKQFEQKKETGEGVPIETKSPEQIKEEEEIIKEQEKKQRAIRALEILSDPEIMERNPKEIVDAFKNLTEDELGGHRHLAKERNEMAYKNLKERGCVVLVGEEAAEEVKQRIIAREQGRIKNEEHSRAIKTFWERNSNIKERDREKYLTNIKKKLGIDGVDGDIAFDYLINTGYLVEKAKTGWFSDKKIPKINSKVALTFESKKDLLQQTAQDAKSKVSIEAQIRAELKIINIKKRILKEKQACAKEIIEKTVEEYKEQQEKNEQRKRDQEEEWRKKKEEESKREEFQKRKKKKILRKTTKRTVAKKQKRKNK